MDWQALISFTVIATVIVVTPGPNFFLIVKSVATGGRRVATGNILGFGCAFLAHGTLSIYGVSAVLTTSPNLFVFIQLLGSGYLLFLGTQCLLKDHGGIYLSVSNRIKLPNSHVLNNMASQPVPLMNHAGEAQFLVDRDSFFQPLEDKPSAFTESVESADKSISISPLKSFFEGLTTNLLNPKNALFYLTAFPQFLIPQNNVLAFSFALVIIHILANAIWYSLIAMSFDTLLQKNDTKLWERALNKFSGIALVALSAYFLTSAILCVQ